MTPLVKKLSKGEHSISLIRYNDADEVRQAVGRGFVLVKFTETSGGTEIGVSLDDTSPTAYESEGRMQLSGTLTLDYQPVRCSFTVDLDSLQGKGSLQPVD